ncbi:hypothetical protein F4703DRAFT_1945056 [Phycomyces blakesleeanus]|uniref:Uncharacterized protein n=1 Tax=Phycomyces blakesleeanus (strain ATCC 8743b / DSM 1359 / FGSC 10004 / NBRC 33097 / NRRL 1555) TaxID=763407 RepID=A0A163CWE3_PHYB8|nr:hypothetical protein PHYBLDRAFT_175613 [Phycomyces blakesleeanus NRRL 1555(-)]OAD66090.1 hypothetical protein PHYBLDRAFT_175613 [Phycomyces blakesleeanus NRRL 1555(-)]|eukprot:XP_018284130.1 hypothetical protein PHYBLDRAFT_175613 [Phycomyces blakesleeanus NRRL 1555(-)]
MVNNQQSSKLGFLFDASHSVFGHCPSLSRFYMSEFQQNLCNYDAKPAQAVERIGCPRCGQIYSPGFNTTVRLEPFGTKKRKQIQKTKPKNRLVYECHACTFRFSMGRSIKAKIPTASLEPNQIKGSVTAQTPASTVPNDKKNMNITKNSNSNNSLSSSDQSANNLHSNKKTLNNPIKKKTKGKSALQAMLAKSKENAGPNKLGLNDFLSSL